MKATHRSSAALLFSLGFALSAGAQPVEQVAPEPKAPGETGIITPDGAARPRVEDARDPAATAGVVSAADEARLNTVLIAALHGLAFTTSAEGARASGPVAGVSAPEELALLGTAEFRDKVAAKHLGRPVTLASIQALNREVVEFFKAHNRPIVDVIVPEQDITEGTLRIIVLEARLGQVSVRGNRHFSSDRLAAQMGAAPGETLDLGRILDDLNWLNQNPFRRVGLVYTRGAELGTTDLVLEVEDRRPLRFYAGYEDSGTDATGQNRWLAGVNWGNAFNLDHQLNYQFTMADHTEDFHAHSLSYVVPLSWRHTLTFYATYANSSAEVVSGLLGADGRSTSAGFRYAIPLRSTPSLSHELSFGYDYKYSRNTLIFYPFPLPATKTDVSQFNLGYGASLRDRFGGTSLSAAYFYSPGRMTAYNSDEDFVATSAGASAEYYYGRATLERLTRLPADFSLVASVTGQASSSNLLVSEQLGAGGHATVRGYDERVANAEQGVIGRVELRAPAFSLADVLKLSIRNDAFQLLGFWDHASLYRHTEPFGLPESYTLSSAGVGFRYSIATNVSVRFDYGWQLLRDSDVPGEDTSRGHVGVVISY